MVACDATSCHIDWYQQLVIYGYSLISCWVVPPTTHGWLGKDRIAPPPLNQK